MDERGQFTFYKSYWDAIEELPSKSQLPILKAIIRYALFGEEPTSLSSVCRAVFLLVKPTLDASRKKAANGKLGGKSSKANDKQNESKPQAPPKQTAREKEGEKEKEIEIEGENNKRSNGEAPVPFDGKSFTAFWDAYPKKHGREAAWEAWRKLAPSADTVALIMSNLDAWKRSGQWTEDGDRYIPKAVNYLSDEGYWKHAPALPKSAAPSGPRELDADEREAIRRMMEEPV